MAIVRKRYSLGRKLLIGLLSLIIIAIIAFQVYIHRYLPSMVKSRLENIIVRGSDSLYRFEASDFDVSFWGRSVYFRDLHIKIDSVKYQELKRQKKLPVMTFDMELPAGRINGIHLGELVFRKRIVVGRIHLQEAVVGLTRHFRSSDSNTVTGQPLWKLIQPDIRSIYIAGASCDNLKVAYSNSDSSTNFRWQFDHCDASFSDIKVDSVSSYDSSRLLFARNIQLAARDIKMKTSDGLYDLQARNVVYSSAGREMDIKEFSFRPAMSDFAFIRHFGYQHEIYKLHMPVIGLKNFLLSEWISSNRLKIDSIELRSPSIAVSMDRNAKPNPYSKKGQYPHQLVQKAPFGIDVRSLRVVDGTVTYTEKNNKNQLTGKLVFPAVRGHISNITNDPEMLKRSTICVADVRSGVMKTGFLHALFRFQLNDKAGQFSVRAAISKLNASQLQPLARAMTSTDLQSFNMHQLQYEIRGNENAGSGDLRMKYDDMDILLNKVEPDGSLDRKGLISFLANRLVIYKENPDGDDGERIADNIGVQRDVSKSFFNFIWKTLYTAAGKIVLRPAAQRKMERRNERRLRQGNRDAAKEKK